ncbi:hypothetical protein [Salarchaeum japonicum]|uniref:Uncharacterized protein n=1 Tax=Salarchaeum japonicum TaxID=555573 RepID=A0AAV3SZL9_9EURY|nr:hypothetical protein [Salarchaeum japonicum]
MTDPHTCPVDDCEFGEGVEKSRAQVTQHIRMTDDGDHDLDELTPEPLDTADTDDEHEDESNDEPDIDESTERDNDSDDSDSSTTPTDASGTPDESTDENDDQSSEGDEMPTQEELARQRENTTPNPAPNDTTDEPPANDGSNSAHSLDFSMPSIDTTTLLWGAFLLVAFLTIYLALRKRSNDETEVVEPTAGVEDEDDESIETPDDMDGGLV